MLSKCANANCQAPFCWGEGKLFQFEMYEPTRKAGTSWGNERVPRIERFWLCASCSSRTTLVLAQGGTVVAEPLAHVFAMPRGQ